MSGCAFSPDSKIILSASWDGTLRLWDSETGTGLMIFPTLSEVSTISIGSNNMIAAEDNIGRFYILQLHNITFGPAIVTPIRLYNFKNQSHNTEFSVKCGWCGVQSPLDDEVVWKKSEEHSSGCLGEVIECLSCQKPLKLTSFVAGKRE